MTDAIGAASLLLPATPRGVDEERRLASKPPAEIAKEFEALLVAQLIGAMRKTIPDGGMLQASAARKMLDGAFDAELARSITAGADLGVARQLTAQLERRGAAASPASGAAATTPAPVSERQAAGPLGAAGPVAASGAPALSAYQAAEHVLPLEGRVTSEFGVRQDPLTGAPRFHGGIDVAAPPGSAIRAAAAGEVVFSGRSGPSGNMVAVRHADGVVTSYAHAARTFVRIGQKVVAGDVLATVGSTGRSTGPHLHFAVERGGQALDPAAFLKDATPFGTAVRGPGADGAEG